LTENYTLHFIAFQVKSFGYIRERSFIESVPARARLNGTSADKLRRTAGSVQASRFRGHLEGNSVLVGYLPSGQSASTILGSSRKDVAVEWFAVDANWEGLFIRYWNTTTHR
jgi:hypothetical protein